MTTPNSNTLKIYHNKSAMISWIYTIPQRYIAKYDIYFINKNKKVKLLGKKLMSDKYFIDYTKNSSYLKIADMTKNDIIFKNVFSKINQHDLIIKLTLLDEDGTLFFKNETLITFIIYSFYF